MEANEIESDASVSMLFNVTEALGSASGYASGDEEVSLVSSHSYQDSYSPKRVKLDRKRSKLPTVKFRTSWKLPKHITASKRGNTYAYCKLCVSDFNIAHGGLNDIKT